MSTLSNKDLNNLHSTIYEATFKAIRRERLEWLAVKAAFILIVTMSIALILKTQTNVFDTYTNPAQNSPPFVITQTPSY